ncbi:hypothetical protein KF728_04125 [Candidatus Obscuribacterales bacterium]|nr:hypothetical protein [Candidatus Obscuribacterales bacterium]MBX3149322.1 hypothetical protein [Candidatus Obscuribacterales bacterium]
MPGKKADSSKKKSSSAPKEPAKKETKKSSSSKSSPKAAPAAKVKEAKPKSAVKSQAPEAKTSEFQASASEFPTSTMEKPAVELDPALRNEFPELFKKIDPKYHEYLTSVINNPWRQFQKSTVDEYLASVEEKGLPVAVAKAIDARDYSRGNSWEQANMNILNNLLPRASLLNDLLKQAVADGCRQAVKWYPEASGNPKEIIEVLKPVLKSDEPKNRWWAAIHLSRHAPDAENLVDILLEAVQADWVALKLDNSSSGSTGKGEAAKALGRLGKNASKAVPTMYKMLDEKKLESADAAHIASALLPISGDVDEIMKHVATIAERVLTEKRGLLIHGGDRELLTTVRSLIAKWHQSEGAKTPELKEKIDLLENEIKYHISL